MVKCIRELLYQVIYCTIANSIFAFAADITVRMENARCDLQRDDNDIVSIYNSSFLEQQ